MSEIRLFFNYSNRIKRGVLAANENNPTRIPIKVMSRSDFIRLSRTKNQTDQPQHYIVVVKNTELSGPHYNAGSIYKHSRRSKLGNSSIVLESMDVNEWQNKREDSIVKVKRYRSSFFHRKSTNYRIEPGDTKNNMVITQLGIQQRPDDATIAKEKTITDDTSYGTCGEFAFHTAVTMQKHADGLRQWHEEVANNGLNVEFGGGLTIPNMIGKIDDGHFYSDVLKQTESRTPIDRHEVFTEMNGLPRPSVMHQGRPVLLADYFENTQGRSIYTFRQKLKQLVA